MPRRQNQDRRALAAQGGFTLIELLVVVAIVALLMGILASALGRARDSARLAGELSNARQLAIAYQMYADDHKGRALPAYEAEPDSPVRNERGELLQGEPTKRWFWKLSPYVQNAFDVFYRDAELLSELRAQSDFSYAITLFPAFGINHRFVGGTPDYVANGGNNIYARTWGTSFWVRNIVDAPRPDTLMSFVSSAEQLGSDFYEGYFRVESPYFTRQEWSSLTPPGERGTLDPSAHGQVWTPASSRVVSALLDGHAEALTWPKAKDMRRWAPQADTEAWTLPAPSRR